MATITLKHVVKRFENKGKKHGANESVVAVADFNLEVADKEFVVLVGPSGCGKSTTLRMIAGLEEITEGELYIDDQLVNDVEPKDRDIAMVFQNYALYPHMTVYENIAFPLKLRKMPKDEIKTRVMEAAQIDGAGKWTKLFKVTIPMMMPSITICMFLSLTNGFKLFDQNLSLTAGEPSKMSEMMALNIFNTFYGRTGWEGVGQAKAVLFFVLVVAISMIQLHMTRSKEVQQ